MLNLKKTAVAVLALGSSAVFAGTMGPVCTPGNVTVPCERTAFDFGIYALYLQPTDVGGLGYAGYNTDTTTGFRQYRDVDPDYNWGFKLEASYHFGMGNDINLNWYHLNKNLHRTFNGTAISFYRADTTGSLFGTASFKPRWDAVNLEVGQFVDFGDFKDIRFHAGAQYAYIQHKSYSNLTGSVITNNSLGASLVVPGPGYLNTRFNGVGPRVGADLTYGFGNGLAVYGNGAVAMLIGTSKFSIAGATPGALFSNADFTVIGGATGSRTVLSPELEGKLGIKYTYAMPQGDLTFDAGWMAVNYFHARHVVEHESGLALQGPYFGLKWVGGVNV